MRTFVFHYYCILRSVCFSTCRFFTKSFRSTQEQSVFYKPLFFRCGRTKHGNYAPWVAPPCSDLALRTLVKLWVIYMNTSLTSANAGPGPRTRRGNVSGVLRNRQATSADLPVADLAAFWSELCDTAFAHLEELLDEEGEQDKDILPHAPGFLNREGFEKAVQGATHTCPQTRGQAPLFLWRPC